MHPLPTGMGGIESRESNSEGHVSDSPLTGCATEAQHLNIYKVSQLNLDSITSRLRNKSSIYGAMAFVS